MAAWNCLTSGATDASCSTPSMRYRTRNVFSKGSMCTSVARSSIASVMIWLTKRIIDAPSAASVRSISSSESVSITWRPFSPASDIIDWTVSAPTPRYFLMHRSISANGAKATRKSRPVARRNSSTADVSKGLLVTTSTSLSAPSTGITCFSRRTRAGNWVRNSLENDRCSSST